ncbi:hypothetical protein GTZ78_06795 [Streptomyces sp. SID8361]|nr:hypothetical protein [Streptomyces sp. SID8361]
MPSVVGLLEQHELAARRRVDELREEADRVQADLATAEQEWQEWVIARRRGRYGAGSGRRQYRQGRGNRRSVRSCEILDSLVPEDAGRHR